MAKRVMRVRGVAVDSEAVKAALEEKLHLLAIDKISLALLSEKIAKAEAELRTGMEEAKLLEIEDRLAVAKQVPTKTNGSTWIDPRKFRESVKDDDAFYSCVTVGVTAAKQFLGQKEIEAIATFTPGAVTGTTVKITLKK